MQGRSRWVAALTIGALVATATIAFADNVQNDVVVGGNDTTTVGASTTVNYQIGQNNGDGQTGCNAADGTAAVVSIIAPTDVTASPSSLTFTSCGVPQPVSFSASAIGEYEITVSVADGNTAGGTYNSNPAKFTLKVTAGAPADTTPPTVTVTGVEDGATYPLGSVPTAGCETSDEDGGSGVATEASVSLSGGPVGPVTATCSGAVDNAGNEADPVSATYTVVYDWTGFLRPVDNLPVLNTVKAGSSVPVKFKLGGDQGLGVMAAGYPRSVMTTCDAAAGSDAIEETATAGRSQLQYDAVTDTYTYVWKTEKTWAGTCRQLQVKLADGTIHAANFSLQK